MLQRGLSAIAELLVIDCDRKSDGQTVIVAKTGGR